MYTIGRKARPAHHRIARSVGVAVVLALALPGCSSSHSGPDQTLTQYLADWSKQDYKDMYQLLSAEARSHLTETAFEERYKAISSGVELTELHTQFQLPQDFKAQADSAELPFQATWKTALVGDVQEKYQAKLSKDQDGWRVDWSPSLIFPGLQDGWKIRVKSTPAARGEITDRNGTPLAVNVPASDVGLVPGKVKDNTVTDLAKALNISADDIKAKLNQAWVKPDSFVPVTTLPKTRESQMEKQLLAIQGVLITPSQRTVRSYPQGILAAQTIGYTGPITADELTADAVKQGYTANDIIGQQGMERVCEKWLRGTQGGEIRMEDASGNNAQVIAHRDPVPGDTVQLTLDAHVQKAFEQAMTNQAGGAVALNPSTGEVLAMASLPSFDPNQLSAGVSAAEWQQLTQNAQTPLVNKALSPVPPGSSIKPFVASIGLDAGAIKPNTVFPQDPVQWQKDASWGSYSVTRVGHPDGNPDLLHALIWSDNVYFAQAGLAIGADKFISGLNKWGLGQPFAFDLPVKAGQVSNDGHVPTEVQLADSAYGQGQMLISPLQLASMFTAFLHNGDTLQPYLIASVRSANGDVVQQGKTQVAAKGVVTANTIQTVTDALHKIVSDPGGTAHGIADLQGWDVAGKTGTAQVQGGQNGSEWGWFSAWAGKTGGPPQYLISMVLANVQHDGDSHATVLRVKAALSQLGQ